MKNFISLLCFLIILNPSLEIIDEDIDKYYEYAIYFLTGLANKLDGEKAQCVSLLEENRDYLLQIIKKISHQMEEGIELSSVISKYIFDLLFLEESCHLTQLLTLYAGIKIENLFNDKLYDIGKVLPDILDYHVN